MINELTIKGLKCFEEAEFHFKNLTLLAVKGARKVFEVGKTVVKKVAQKAADIGSRVLEHVGNLVSNFAGFLGF